MPVGAHMRRHVAYGRFKGRFRDTHHVVGVDDSACAVVTQRQDRRTRGKDRLRRSGYGKQ